MPGLSKTLKTHENCGDDTTARRDQAVFPLQLYDMLMDAEKDPALQAIVSWLPDGKSFILHKKNEMESVLKRYFNGVKVGSFTKQLNIYGFAQQRYTGICSHVWLQRGQRHLLHNKSINDFKDFKSLSLNKSKSSDGTNKTNNGTNASVDSDDSEMKTTERNTGS